MINRLYCILSKHPMAVAAVNFLGGNSYFVTSLFLPLCVGVVVFGPGFVMCVCACVRACV